MTTRPTLTPEGEYAALADEARLLEQRRDKINQRLMQIQNRQHELCPVSRRRPSPHPLRRSDDVLVPMPASTAAALTLPHGRTIELPRVDAVQLQVLDTSPRVEVEIFAPLPEPCPYTEALFEDREPGPSFDGLHRVLSALPDEQPGFYAIHEFEEKQQ